MIAECFLTIGSAFLAIGAYRTFYQVQPSPDQVVALPKLKLQPGPMPASMYWLNVRSAVSEKVWIGIKRVMKGSKIGASRCVCCGSTGDLELHEQWEFIEPRTQKLVGLKLLCHLCHMVNHIGYAFNKNEGAATLAHFMKINGISKSKAEQYIKANSMEAKRLNSYSSITKSRQYKLDLTFLNQNKFNLLRRFTEDERDNCKRNIKM